MGRFEQLRRWDTFKDAESMSHAALGIEVLFGENPADAPATTSIRDFIDDPASTTSSSERASPITATFACRHNSTSVHGASAISCAMATRSTLCAPSPTAPSTPSSRWMRTRFSPVGSRHRHLPPLTSTAASHAMNATSPQTTWWDSSALCLSSSIQQAARWRANRAISTACSTRPLALRDPLPIPPRKRPGSRLKDEMRDWLARA